MNKASSFLRKYRAVCVTGALILAAIIAFSLTYKDKEARSPRYELESSGGVIDFEAPDVTAHTAADGIAVIRPSKKPEAAADHSTFNPAEVPAISAAEPVRITDDPGAIWRDEAAPVHTHSGFTVPVLLADESIGVLTIPDIGLSVRVFEGEDEMESMAKGVAYFRHTSAWFGNIGLSAHNINLDGSPGYFLDLHKLQKGAVITYETAQGRRAYAVESVAEIDETDWSGLERTSDNRLTLITCITGKQSKRLMVTALEAPN